MKALQTANKEKGFTIVELVVVILLLGILTATALPRFMDVSDEAHAAAVDAVESGLRTGMALYQAQWMAVGEPSDATGMEEFNSLYPSAAGWPAGLGDATLSSHTDCVDVWNNILQGGRPAIIAADDDALDNAVEDPQAAYDGDAAAEAAEAGYSYIAFSPAATSCEYYYLKNPSTLGTSYVTYDAAGGAVGQEP